MEGVGARSGRSSTRYSGPTTVFTGPVRKWKKRWVHVVSPPSINNTINTKSLNNHNNNGGGLQHELVLFKWAPFTQTDNNKSNSVNRQEEEEEEEGDDSVHRKRKFRYIPIIEEQIKEDLDDVENVDEETFPTDDTDPNAGSTLRTNDFDENLDVDDVPMGDNKVGNQVVRQDLNESLDLSLG
ncbi:hypothetical protein ACFE04_031183 [Oxalis oulophora]